MSKTQSVPALRGNQLLARLPADEFNRLFPDPQPVALEFKHVLYEPRAPIEFASFPNIGVVSQVTVMEDGALSELSTVGNEGMIASP